MVSAPEEFKVARSESHQRSDYRRTHHGRHLLLQPVHEEEHFQRRQAG